MKPHILFLTPLIMLCVSIQTASAACTGSSSALPAIGRVLELLINSKKASTSPIFEEYVERFLCLRFSITHTHDPTLD